MKKKLGFYDYKQLSVNDQYDLVFKEGVFLGASEIGSRKFALYQLYNFYVEVEYDADANKIVNLVCKSYK
ncbi:hypothetical protein G6R40_12110 [Chryseobacterium sp. POL2]|uniref:hypothetical protein n=1 Tax=Chryseobacterium sp. POL2 TaxID=2713414 RepID=UPI0013E18D94|nr:hypothetical protein [Chryseobacterium sp. POL2]QIG90354.1 hypothetical protein G6R40_12110 [Chryseobacterium sp. POL2]